MPELPADVAELHAASEEWRRKSGARVRSSDVTNPSLKHGAAPSLPEGRLLRGQDVGVGRRCPALAVKQEEHIPEPSRQSNPAAAATFRETRSTTSRTAFLDHQVTPRI